MGKANIIMPDIRYEWTMLEDIECVEGVDISIRLSTIFESVVQKFNEIYPRVPLFDEDDMVKVCQLGRDIEIYKENPEILIPYTQLCTLINRDLHERGIHRFLVY